MISNTTCGILILAQKLHDSLLDYDFNHRSLNFEMLNSNNLLEEFYSEVSKRFLCLQNSRFLKVLLTMDTALASPDRNPVKKSGKSRNSGRESKTRAKSKLSFWSMDEKNELHLNDIGILKWKIYDFCCT